MTSQNQRRWTQFASMTLASVIIGAIGIVYSLTLFSEYSSQIYTLKSTRDSEIVEYLDRSGAHFQNDSELSIPERIDILQKTNKLDADQLSNILIIQKSHQEKIDQVANPAIFAVFIVSLVALVCGVLFFTVEMTSR